MEIWRWRRKVEPPLSQPVPFLPLCLSSLLLSRSVEALFSLGDAMNRSFYELGAHLFRSSRNIGRTLFPFSPPPFTSPPVHSVARASKRNRIFHLISPSFSPHFPFSSLRKGRTRGFSPRNDNSMTRFPHGETNLRHLDEHISPTDTSKSFCGNSSLRHLSLFVDSQLGKLYFQK